MSAHIQLSAKKRRLALGLMFGVLLLVMMGFSVLFPIQADYAKQFGVDAAVMGMISGIYSLMHFICAPIWGRISDRVGRRPVLMIGLLGYVFSQTVFGLATEVWMLFAARTLAGMLSAGAMPTTMAYIADITPPEERAKGMGLMGAAFGLGVILGPGVGGVLGTISLGLPFFVSAGLSLLAFLTVLFLLPESLPPEARTVREQKRESRWKAMTGEMAALYGVTFALSLGMVGVEHTFSFFAAERLGLEPDQTSWIFVIMGIVAVIVQGGLVGRVKKALGESRMALVGLAVGALGMALVPLTTSPVVVTVAICVLAVGNSLAQPANSALISQRALVGQGTAIGLMDSFNALGRIIGPTAAGAVFNLNPGLPYVSGAVLFALAFALSLFWALSVGRTQPAGSSVSS